jgi:hypothetical protein
MRRLSRYSFGSHKNLFNRKGKRTRQISTQVGNVLTVGKGQESDLVSAEVSFSARYSPLLHNAGF